MSLTLWLGGDLGDHLPVIGGGAEQGRIERDLAGQPALDGGGKFGSRDFGALGHAGLVDDQDRIALGRAQGLDRIGNVFGVAQIGEIGLGDDHHLIDSGQGVAHPVGPDMRQVEHDDGHVLLAQFHDLLETALAKIVGAVERGRGGQAD